jgi:tripartite-type tricarboxylate transporter receptor subunit TctC
VLILAKHIKSGQLRALAVTGATRLLALPDVPAVGEFLPGYEARGWSGIVATKTRPLRSSTNSIEKSISGSQAPD